MTETVLVTGGTGFIARWCIVELLERGYVVRTTVRSPEKEASVRAAVATAVDPGDRLTCVVADLTADDGWDAASVRVRLRAPRRVAARLRQPERPGRTDRSRARRRVASAARRDRGGRQASGADVGRQRREPVVVCRRGCHRRDAVDRSERSRAARVSQVQDRGRAVGVGVHGVGERTDHADDDPARCGVRPDPRHRQPRFGAGDPAPVARRHAGHAEDRPRGRRRARRGRHPHPRDDVTGRRGPALPRDGRVHVDERHRPCTARATSAPMRARCRRATSRTPWCARCAVAKPELKGIMPGLGRKNRHTTAKAEALLGWKPRPAADTVLDCARSLIEHQAI